MGEFGSVLFIVAVVALWLYAGYRVVTASHRKYAAVRYVSPLLVLGLALIVYSFFESADTARFIIAWTVPAFVVLFAAALMIDRARGRSGQVEG